jgi:dephospho-CoA kinase
MAIKVIGLTGGVGSGKSTVADLFAEHGVAIVDTDLVSRRLTGPDGEAMGSLAAAFGAEFVRVDGSLDRAAMRQLVFSDVAARTRLEGILHPMIMMHGTRELQQAQGPYAMLVVPLLFETARYQPLVMRSLVVDCDEQVQLQRVVRRSHLSADEAHAIMAAQMSRRERCARADDIIENNGSLDELRLQVEVKHRYYLEILG